MGAYSRTAVKILAVLVLAASLFGGGYVAAQNHFGQPKTIIHVVEIKWNPGVPAAEKVRVLAGIKTMAGQIPGVKNIWIKADRLEPRDFDAAFAIEFRDRDAADAYAESPIHKAWDNAYVPLRETSVSIQVSNP